MQGTDTAHLCPQCQSRPAQAWLKYRLSFIEADNARLGIICFSFTLIVVTAKLTVNFINNIVDGTIQHLLAFDLEGLGGMTGKRV